MEEMLYKFIEEGKGEHEEMRSFICDFQTINEILFKERNNSLIDLRFGVQELLRVINNTPTIDCEVKGVTTRGGKTTTQDAQNDDTSVHTEEPQAEKEEAQQKKFLENLKQLYINLPFIEALAQMPKYAKFHKGLLTNKGRLEEACTITMNERCSAVLLNKLPSKEKNPGSFTIPCDIGQFHINNALADLGASISLMPYTMYENIGLDFVILDMPEDSRVPIILGRPFLANARALIDVFNKKITLRELLDSILSRGLEKSIDQSYPEGYKAIECKTNNDSISDEPIRRIASINTPNPVVQEAAKPIEVEKENLYLAIANDIDEKKHELKDLPHHLEYAYLHGDKNERERLLRKFQTSRESVHHIKILMEDDFKPVIQPQRHLNPKVHGVVKNKIVKLLDSGLIYLISDSLWVSPIHVVPKKGGTTVVLNDNKELIPSRTVTRWRVCIDYHKLNDATRNDHFPLPFIDQILERLCGNEYYSFLDGFLGFFEIPIAPKDQEKTTFTCPYRSFAYRRMPFGLCIAPATFQRCMTTIFHDMVEDFMEVFIDDFSVFGIKVDRAKIDMIAKLPYPRVRSFLGHAGFYRSNFTVGAILGQRIDGKYKPIYYASKTLNNTQEHYTTSEKELLAVVFSFDKFCPYLVLSKTIVYTDHSALKYLFSKQDAKPRLIRWVMLLQGFDIEIKDKRGAQNLAADHLLRLENPDLGTFTEEEIADEFPNEHLMVLKTELNNDEPCASVTGRKVYESGFFWPSIFKDAKDYVMRFDGYLTAAAKNYFMELNELMELRDDAYENTRIYKERTKRWHDSRLWGDKNFKVGDMVLLFNSRFKMRPRKLKSRWTLDAKKSSKLVKYQSSGVLCVIVDMLAFKHIYNTDSCSINST
ncbi:DNA-directed DNA polymerase [Tanacetum coccineum]